MIEKPAETYLAKIIISWNTAKDTATGFYDQLVAEMTKSDALVAMGSIDSVGKNSSQQRYKSYGPANDTQSELRDLWASLISLYEREKEILTNLFLASADFDYEVPADYDFEPEIYKQMKNLFEGMIASGSTTLPNITRLRLPACVNLGPTPVTW